MYCSKCGKEIADGSEYCKYCGKSTSDNVEKNKNNSIAGIIIAIISIIGAVLVIYSLLSGINKKYENTMKDFENIRNSISFNCPYCKKYNRINKNSLLNSNNYYSCLCTNCMKSLRIDKRTYEVTLLNKEYY